MGVTYLVAALVAVAAAFAKPDYPKLPYWQRWDPAATNVALGCVYAIYALTGVAVAGLAQHLGWEVLSTGAGREWANGAAYGIAALGILKLEVSSFGLSSVAPARLLLRGFLERFETSLQSATNRAVARRVGDLTVLQLCQISWRLFMRHVKPDLEREATKWEVICDHSGWLHALHIQALSGQNATDPALVADAIEAQERLRHYIEELIIDNSDDSIDLRDDVPR